MACSPTLAWNCCSEPWPQGPFHADVVRRLSERLIRQLPAGVHTRVLSPLALSVDSEPEPDIAVVPEGNYTAAHPTTALLVIEVADSSLPKDRGVKAALYAMSGIEDYWLVDLSARAVEVHRAPTEGRYARVERVDVNGRLVPLAFTGVGIPIDELLAQSAR